jgi:hypothetical protein
MKNRCRSALAIHANTDRSACMQRALWTTVQRLGCYRAHSYLSMAAHANLILFLAYVCDTGIPAFIGYLLVRLVYSGRNELIACPLHMQDRCFTVRSR